MLKSIMNFLFDDKQKCGYQPERTKEKVQILTSGYQPIKTDSKNNTHKIKIVINK